MDLNQVAWGSRCAARQKKGTYFMKSPHFNCRIIKRLAVLVSALFAVGATATPASSATLQPVQQPKVDIAAVGATSQPQPLAYSRYGAIAYSPSTLGANSAVSTASQGDARGNALYKCNQMIAAKDCRVEVSFTNSWGALAISTPNGPVGTGIGPTADSAKSYAIYWCRYYGGGDRCRNIVWINATYVR